MWNRVALLCPLLIAMGLSVFQQWSLSQRVSALLNEQRSSAASPSEPVTLNSLAGALISITLLGVGVLLPLVHLLWNLADCQRRVRALEEKLARDVSRERPA